MGQFPGTPPMGALLRHEQSIYLVGELIGKGGSGTVHNGWELSERGGDHTEVAIKIGKKCTDEPSHLRMIEIFRREEELGRRLGIWGFVLGPLESSSDYEQPNGEGFEELKEAMKDKNRPCLIMAKEQGRQLQNYVEGSLKTSMRIMLHWFEKAADQVAWIHKRGLTHCDLKPGNILVDGSKLRIVDFNSAKKADDEAYTSSTPAFCSPQQLEAKQLKAQQLEAKQLKVAGFSGTESDVYSLCATFWNLFATVSTRNKRDLLFREATNSTLAKREALRNGIIRWGKLNRDLLDLLLQGLSEEPENRPTAEELLAKIKAARKKIKNKKMVMMGLGVLTPVLVLFLTLWAYSWNKDQDQRLLEQARRELDRDPTRSVALLKDLSCFANPWAAWTVLQEARLRGVARLVDRDAGTIQSLALNEQSAAGTMLAAGTREGTVYLWRDPLTDKEPEVLMASPGQEFRRLSFSPDGSRLALLAPGKVQVVSFEKGAPPPKPLKPPGLTDENFLLSVRLLERDLLLGTSNGKLLYYKDLDRWQQFDTSFVGHISDMDHRGNQVVLSGQHGIEFRGPDGNKLTAPWIQHDQLYYLSVDLSRDGKHLVSSTEIGVPLWDLNDPDKPPRFLDSGNLRVNSVRFIHGGKTIAGSRKRDVLLWDRTSEELTGILRGHDGEVTAMAASNGGEFLITGCTGGEIRYWKVPPLTGDLSIEVKKLGVSGKVRRIDLVGYRKNQKRSYEIRSSAGRTTLVSTRIDAGDSENLHDPKDSHEVTSTDGEVSFRATREGVIMKHRSSKDFSWDLRRHGTDNNEVIAMKLHKNTLTIIFRKFQVMQFTLPESLADVKAQAEALTNTCISPAGKLEICKGG